MAAWQFDVHFMPDAIVADARDYIEQSQTPEGLDTWRWWRAPAAAPDLSAIVSLHFNEISSYSKDVLRWGSEKEVLIEAFLEKGKIESVIARIDMRYATPKSFERLARVGAALLCQFYLAETDEVVGPDSDLLQQRATTSRAATYIDLGRDIASESKPENEDR